MTRDHYVYRLFDAEGSLLYVGCTVDVTRRLREHARERLWWPEVVSHTVSEPMRRPAAVRAEQSAIHLERPRYNTRHNPQAPRQHIVTADRQAEMQAAVARLGLPQGVDAA